MDTPVPKKLRILAAVLTVPAAVILCWAVWGYRSQLPDPFWVVLLFLALVTAPVAIFIRTAETIVPMDEMYLMAIAMISGPATCIIATAICSFFLLLLARMPKGAFLVSFSSMICNAFLYSMAFHLTAPADASGIGALVLPAVILAFVSFLFTSFLATMVVSWRLGKRLSWAKMYIPLSLNSFIAAGAAAFIASWSKDNLWIPLAFAPVVFLIWWWTRLHKARLERVTIPSKA